MYRPYHARHLVTVEFDDGCRHLDLADGFSGSLHRFTAYGSISATASTAAPNTANASTSEAFRRVDSKPAQRAARSAGPARRRALSSPPARRPGPRSSILPDDVHAHRDARQHDQVGHPGQPATTASLRSLAGRTPGAGGPVAGDDWGASARGATVRGASGGSHGSGCVGPGSHGSGAGGGRDGSGRAGRGRDGIEWGRGVTRRRPSPA